MGNVLLKKIRSIRTVTAESRSLRPVMSIFFVVFFIGIAAGSLVGIFSVNDGLDPDIGAYISAGILPKFFLQTLVNSFNFLALALVFSTSYLGIVLIPSLALVRGYSLSCSVAALFSAYSYKGLALSAFAAGIPALLTVPCFAVICCDAFVLSRRLFLQRFHAAAPLSDSRLVKHFLIVLPVVIFESFYSFSLLPLILAKLY